MRTKWWIVYTTICGDNYEWTRDEHKVFATEQEAIEHQKSEETMVGRVGGVEAVETTVEQITEKELREILTVEEYFDLYPQFKKIIDKEFGY